MSAPSHKCFALLFAAASLLGGSAAAGFTAQAEKRCAHLRHPQTGQPGKDVVWMPTSDALAKQMLQLAGATKDDRIYDLGSGDGRIPITAAKEFGATAVGIEYDRALVTLANCFASAEGIADKVKFVAADIFAFDFSAASVVTLYLLPELNLRLRPTLLAMKPGTRVVSHSWLMDEWEPDGQVAADRSHAYLWIVPANVEGTWTFVREDGDERFTVQLEQAFQNIKGRIASGDGSRPLWRSSIRGTQIAFSYADSSTITAVDGVVAQDRIDARVTRNGEITRFVGKRL